MSPTKGTGNQAGRSHTKGAAFERLVAKQILDACRKLDPTLKSEDCYRTPLSGGHPMGPKTDLVISPRLARIWPYKVECKHHKRWSLAELLRPASPTWQWVREAPEGTIVVVRGHRTPVYAIAPASAAVDCSPSLRTGDYVVAELPRFIDSVLPWKDSIQKPVQTEAPTTEIREYLRKVGRIGGKRRDPGKIPAERRREIARKAAEARWGTVSS